MDKRVPERTCVGCGRKGHKDELVRIVFIKDETAGDSYRIEVDPETVKKGRGAYLCLKSECLELALKKRAFNRAFKQGIGQDLLEGLRDDFVRRLSETR